uniref:Uncharacterized protein n=1 Tax=Kalanchoe fedtschenkoi TaxID=63787 RepID=A0A7N0UT16_KALFE
MVLISHNSSKCYKVRSISFPARGDQLGAITIAEELKKLKSWLASSSSSQQADAVCSGLEALNQLYGSMKQLLASPQTLQALSNSQHEKWVAEMIQGSIVFIDICGKARDGICQMRECTTELQSALRRKKGNEVIDIESNVEAYAGFRKNMKKGMERSLAELKQIENKNKSAGCSPHTQQTTSSSHILNVVRVLREASSATNLMFQRLVLFLSMPVMKPKPSRWSLAKLVTRGASNVRGDWCKNDFEGVDMEVMNLPVRSSAEVGEDDHGVDSALEKLESLDRSMKSTENELERLFKHLICMRVTYLNICSQ